MKKCLKILFLGAAILLAACHNEDGLPKACLGECSYYPGFLWSDADTCGVTKHLLLDFNKDAKEDKNTFAEIVFVDKDGNPIPDEVLEVTVNGVVIKDNTFKVYPNEVEKEVKFRYLPKAESGNHQGYIKLLSYKLDRCEDKELDGSPTVIMRWDLRFNKCMNPLAKVLMWICILFLVLLLVWFLVVRPIRYPRFKSIRKGIYFKDSQPITINFKSARLVVLDSKLHKQSNCDKIFKGKIIYKQHPALLTKIIMKPHRRGVMVITDTSKYVVTPNPMPKIGSAMINDLVNKTNIEIK